ncbi:hypothetical protein [Aquimarina pacifica]|uniref:hypothetical protein n=1 Tax=Aquimarina pacifica TaxID=1296415 RepID=UPI0004BA35B9|nr:hypothetical protein [Aquimarina pacifica]
MLTVSTNVFEKKVLKRLSIEPVHFEGMYGGYAILLSNWIKDCHSKGKSVTEVVREINRSKLKIRITESNR